MHGDDAYFVTASYNCEQLLELNPDQPGCLSPPNDCPRGVSAYDLNHRRFILQAWDKAQSGSKKVLPEVSINLCTTFSRLRYKNAAHSKCLAGVPLTFKEFKSRYWDPHSMERDDFLSIARKRCRHPKMRHQILEGTPSKGCKPRCS